MNPKNALTLEDLRILPSGSPRLWQYLDPCARSSLGLRSTQYARRELWRWPASLHECLRQLGALDWTERVWWQAAADILRAGHRLYLHGSSVTNLLLHVAYGDPRAGGPQPTPHRSTRCTSLDELLDKAYCTLPGPAGRKVTARGAAVAILCRSDAFGARAAAALSVSRGDGDGKNFGAPNALWARYLDCCQADTASQALVPPWTRVQLVGGQQ